MWGECISGALYINDFHSLAKAAGFEHPVVLQKAEIAIRDPRMRALLGNAKLFSITYRLFKLPGLLEPYSEDYGQVAIYKVSPASCLPTHMHHCALCGTIVLLERMHCVIWKNLRLYSLLA